MVKNSDLLRGLDPRLQEAYRRDHRLARYRMFAAGIRSLDIATTRLVNARSLLALEVEMYGAHPPFISRPLFTLTAGLFMSILATVAAMERSWTLGYTSNILYALIWAMYFLGAALSLIPPRAFRERELFLFIGWYLEEQTLAGNNR
jgi:hypothetical protein